MFEWLSNIFQCQTQMNDWKNDLQSLLHGKWVCVSMYSTMWCSLAWGFKSMGQGEGMTSLCGCVRVCVHRAAAWHTYQPRQEGIAYVYEFTATRYHGTWIRTYAKLSSLRITISLSKACTPNFLWFSCVRRPNEYLDFNKWKKVCIFQISNLRK